MIQNSSSPLRKIIHVDMDCFYAAVEERERPEIRGRPVVVGGDPHGRGVVATANYPARKFGIRSAMGSSQAFRLCPDAIFIRPRFKLYKEESLKIREIFSRYTLLVEPLSLDEAYLDVTETQAFQGLASKMAAEIRRAIRAETGLTASAGVGPNKFIAKLASEFRKPDGLTVVQPKDVESFVAALPIEAIPGIGRVSAAKMRGLGFKSCADLKALEYAEMVRRFGAWGAKLFEYVRGIDERPVKSERKRKSVSVENTFSADLVTEEELDLAVDKIFREFLVRLEKIDTPIKNLFVKVKFFDFEQTTFERADVTEPDLAAYKDMVKTAWARKAAPVRLIGLGVRLVQHKETKDQLTLFG